MSEENNDSIEDFFKKAVRKSDITYRESDWQKMEKMLDEQSGTVPTIGSGRIIKGGIVVVAVILLSTLSYWIITGSEKTNTAAQTSAENKTEGVSQMSADRAEVGDSAANSRAHDDVEIRADREKARVTSTTSENETVTKTKLSPTLSSGKELISDNIKEHSSKGDNLGKAGQGKVRTNPETIVTAPLHRRRQKSGQILKADEPKLAKDIERISGEKNIDALHAGENAVRKTSNSESDYLNNNNEKVDLAPTSSGQTHEFAPDRLVDIAVKDESIADDDAIDTPAAASRSGSAAPANELSGLHEKDAFNLSPSSSVENTDSVITALNIVPDTVDARRKKSGIADEESARKPTRWNIALVGAPDFSAMKVSQISSPGPAFGLLIGYRVWGRVTVSSGVIKSFKRYSGDGKDYHPPTGYWQYATGGMIPEEVYGQCSILEIPLLIQVDLWKRAQSRSYISAGLSSYRMTDESYRYYFEGYVPSAISYEWSTDKASTYAWGVGHLSAAYEHTIYKGLSLGVEPYVKLPLKGIGWAKIDLFSVGAYVNLRYTFSRKNI